MTAIDAIVTASNVPVSTISTSSTTTSPKQTMDSEMFLKLLVAQLRAQDPSSPMDTNAMMTQTTQLASMEQLTSLTDVSTENFSLQMRIAATSIIGKDVSYVDSAGVTRTGTATAVSFASSTPTVTIGTSSIPLDSISGVSSAS